MTSQLLVTPELIQEAKNFKGEFLIRTFGAFLQEVGQPELSQLNNIPRGSNIVGVGYGLKQSGNTIAEDVAVRVYVRSKLPKSQIPADELVPSAINGKATDVIPVYDLSALARPVECGTSVGHFDVTAGTLGCLVKKSGGDGQEVFILSNNHVLVNSNQASLGDSILEPGKYDGGTVEIAKLSDFETIQFNGQANFIDAAIATQYQRLDDLRLHLSPGELLITPDDWQIILQELLDNAFKFSEPGSPVTVTTQQLEHQFRFTLQDFGRGMTPQQIQAIGAYQQFDRPQQEQQGAGLGLAIAKKMTELYGGQWEIASTPQGTQLTLTWPLPA